MEVDSPMSPVIAAKKAKPSDQGSEEVRQFFQLKKSMYVVAVSDTYRDEISRPG